MIENGTIFEIVYNNGNGKMQLNLEGFFARKENGRFLHTIKPDIYTVLQLIHDWCDEEKVNFLLNFLSTHKCQDIVDYYHKKYDRRK